MKKIGKNLKDTSYQLNDKGITVVVLVVTIIILLILAGVSLSLVFNSDGLFQKTNYLADRYNVSKNEEIDFLTNLVESMNAYYGMYGVTETPNPTVTPLLPTENIDGEGAMKYIKLDTGPEYINTKNVYGEDVLGYTCSKSGVEWQIFYIDAEDNNRVYLIAKDYMVPPTTETELTRGTNSSYPKAYYFNTTLLNKYKKTIPSNSFTEKFLSEYAGTNASGQGNLQATNYMLDQTIWSEYLNLSMADYAFGGPTLPLFKASYNDICKSSTILGYKKGETGYEIKQGTGSWTNSGNMGYGDTSMQKGIYFYGNSSDSAHGMWLASPMSYSDTDCIMGITHDGGVGCGWYYDWNMGFRPIVALQSNVQFKAKTDGKGYEIVN